MHNKTLNHALIGRVDSNPGLGFVKKFWIEKICRKKVLKLSAKNILQKFTDR